MKNKKGPFHSAIEEVSTANQRPSKPDALFAFTDQQFLLREELRPVRIQLELLRPEIILNDHQIENAVAFFGSARIPSPDIAKTKLDEATAALQKAPNDPKLKKAHFKATRIMENSGYLKEAQKLAQIVSTSEFMKLVVFTGGGPSFMSAANQGAKDANKKSVALNILHPQEQTPNDFVTPSLTFQFHYFSIRKMHFLIRAKALVAFPGGFGTLDELFESLTLLQTNKIEPIPVILFNKTFWERIINFEALVEEGTIDEKDLALFKFAETAEQAFAIIEDFYKDTD